MDKCCEKWAHTATFWARATLGLFFLIAGWNKIAGMEDWMAMLAENDTVLGEGGLRDAFGAVLPWAELIAGLALTVGFKTRWAAWLIALMLVAFLINSGITHEMMPFQVNVVLLGSALSLALTGSKAWSVDGMMK